MSNLGYLQTSLKDSLLSVSLFCHLASIILCTLILSETLALYKSFTYLLTKSCNIYTWSCVHQLYIKWIYDDDDDDDDDITTINELQYVNTVKRYSNVVLQWLHCLAVFFLFSKVFFSVVSIYIIRPLRVHNYLLTYFLKLLFDSC